MIAIYSFCNNKWYFRALNEVEYWLNIIEKSNSSEPKQKALFSVPGVFVFAL
jgi:hypothetical protein